VAGASYVMLASPDQAAALRNRDFVTSLDVYGRDATLAFAAPQAASPGRPNRMVTYDIWLHRAEDRGAVEQELQIRVSGFTSASRRRVRSVQPCADGVEQKNWNSETWLIPLEAQIAGLRLDDEAVVAIAEALTKPEAAVLPIERGRLEHRRRQLAFDVAAGRIGERAFLTAIRRLTEEEARVEDGGPARQGVDAAKAIDYIRNFASSWAKAKPPTKAMMVQSLYEEIVVRGAEFVSVRLTPEAYVHGLALALPQEVLVPAMRTKGRPRKCGHWRARQELSAPYRSIL
jgi:hypothetical protein